MPMSSPQITTMFGLLPFPADGAGVCAPGCCWPTPCATAAGFSPAAANIEVPNSMARRFMRVRR